MKHIQFLANDIVYTKPKLLYLEVTEFRKRRGFWKRKKSEEYITIMERSVNYI
jgi:hypothetical protein